MTSDVDKISKRLKKIVLIIGLIFIGIVLIFGGVAFIAMMPVNSKSTEEITFVIEPGSGKNKIINDLQLYGFIVDKIMIIFINFKHIYNSIVKFIIQ